MALVKRLVAGVPDVEFIKRESPEGDHQANGEAENAVREIKRQARAIKSATENKLGKRLSEKDPLLSWLPRHASDLLNRYRVGEDGKTAEQRRCGREWHNPALCFGEKVFIKPAGTKRRKNDLEPRMSKVDMWDIIRGPAQSLCSQKQARCEEYRSHARPRRNDGIQKGWID